jgi:hypothetical protein
MFLRVQAGRRKLEGSIYEYRTVSKKLRQMVGWPRTHVVAYLSLAAVLRTCSASPQGHLGVFYRTATIVAQYDCDSVRSEGSPCISAFDSETALSVLTERECLVQEYIPTSPGSSTVTPQKRSSVQYVQSRRSSIFHQLRPIVFGIL